MTLSFPPQVATAVDEERTDRIAAGKAQAAVWNQALAELGSALRSEAQDNLGAVNASR